MNFLKIPSDSESATPKTVGSEKISKKTNLQKNDLPDEPTPVDLNP